MFEIGKKNNNQPYNIFKTCKAILIKRVVLSYELFILAYKKEIKQQHRIKITEINLNVYWNLVCDNQSMGEKRTIKQMILK